MARFVWNLALEQRRLWTRRQGATPGFTGQCRELTEARRESEWLRSGSVTVQQQALRDLDQAYRNWWQRPDHFSRPTWRKRGAHESFRLVGVQARARTNGRRSAQVWVPGAGWVNFRLSRALPDNMRSYRITRDSCGRWHVAFAHIPASIAARDDAVDVIGIDRGVANTAALSNGMLVQLPTAPPTEQARTLRLERKLARQRKGSKRRERTKRDLARLKHRTINRRKDVIEKLTTDLARSAHIVRLEKLEIRNMTRSARGTLSEPGTNVRQKAGLNRAILASGWGLLERRLNEKMPDRVEYVDAAYTSQRCNQCGTIDASSRKNQAHYTCTSCGHVDHADLNAAHNIAEGRSVTARGRRPIGPRAKREPQPSRAATAAR